MTSSFFFKMLLLRQFLPELNDIRTQCSPIWCVYMVHTDDVITYNHCRNLGLNISETTPDSGMVTMDGLYKLVYGLSIGHTPDDVT